VEYDINLKTYWLVLKRHKALIMLIALGMGAVTTLLTFLNRPDPIFESAATVKIEKSSTATGVYLEAISWSGADYLETQASIITSYPILEKVAADLGKISPELSSTVIRTDPRYIALIMELKAKVKAEREGTSNLINITAQDQSPRFAQQLASTMARVYTEEHTAEVNKRTYDARKFIEEQLGHVADRLRKAEEALKEFEETNHAISLDNQTSTMLSRLAQSETEALAIDKQKKEISEALTRLNSALLSPPSATSSFLFSGAPELYNTLNSKLVTLLMQRESLLLNYTAEHPEVKSVDSQLAEILRNLNATLKEQLDAVDKRLNAAQDTTADIEQQLAELPGKGLMLERLKREVQLNGNIYSLLENKLQEARIMEASKIEEVIVVKPALEPIAPTNHTSVAAKGLAGLAMGLIMGLMAAILSEAMNTSLDSVEQVEKFTSLDVMATVGPLDRQDVMTTARALNRDDPADTKGLRRIIHLPAHFLPGSRVAESYREIMAALRLAALDRPLKTIAFTSASADEGKTTAILNTAIALAQANYRVLVIEADMRQPMIASWFGLPPTPGLTDIMLNAQDRYQAIRTITDLILGDMQVEEVTLTPGLDNLFILPCGTRPANPSEILFNRKFQNLLKNASSRYDMVLIDLPPILASADTAIISSHIDGLILVYKAGITERHLLRRAIDQLRQSKTNPLGIVMNSTGRKQPGFEQGHDAANKPQRALQSGLTFIKKPPAQLWQGGNRWLIATGTALVATAMLWSFLGGSQP